MRPKHEHLRDDAHHASTRSSLVWARLRQVRGSALAMSPVGHGPQSFRATTGDVRSTPYGRSLASLLPKRRRLTFADYLGRRTENECEPGPLGAGGCQTIAGHSLAYGAELGYGFHLGRATLRPQVGVGDLEIHQTVSPGGRDIAPGMDYLYFEPGLVVLVALGFVYVGADANLMLLPFGPSNAFDGATGKPATAVDPVFTAHAQVGVRF